MAIIRDDAVVLTRHNYSETSQIIVLLTRGHGKLRTIAKGIRRSTKTRFAAGIDLLELGHVVVSSPKANHQRSSTLATVTEWKQTRSLSGLREKLFRLHGAQYAAEITSQLTEDWDPHVELFDALLSTLVELSDASEPFAPVVGYQLKLLESVGSQPRFDACVLCGRRDDLTHFSSFEGGMICRHCEPVQIEKREVSSAALQICMVGTACPTRAQIAPTTGPLTGAFSLLNYHIAHLMGREPVLAAKLVPVGPRRMVE